MCLYVQVCLRMKFSHPRHLACIQPHTQCWVNIHLSTGVYCFTNNHIKYLSQVNSLIKYLKMGANRLYNKYNEYTRLLSLFVIFFAVFTRIIDLYCCYRENEQLKFVTWRRRRHTYVCRSMYIQYNSLIKAKFTWNACKAFRCQALFLLLWDGDPYERLSMHYCNVLLKLVYPIESIFQNELLLA